jgi:hypothetical protein
MKMTLPKFYALFMLVSLGLFSYENKSVQEKTLKPKIEETAKTKEDKPTKKTYRHYYRFSNLC